MNSELQTKLSKIIEILQSLIEHKPQQTKQEVEEEKYKEFLEIAKQGDKNKIYEWIDKNHKSKSEKIQEIANALGIDKKHIQQDRAEKLATGNRNRFEVMNADIATFDLKILKNYDLDFFSCSFHCNIELHETFRFLWFANCQFQNINIDAIGENLIFGSCKFLGKFLVSKGESCLDVENCIFNEAIFKNSIFSKKTSFTMCEFKNAVDFSRTTFKDQTSFYGTTFYACPNFSYCRFEGEVNLINTNLLFNYDNTCIQIIRAWKQRNNDFGLKIPKQYIANDFRDIFRLFKNTLSKEGNILDASNYHRVELYCKEVELDSKVQKTWRDWVDWAQLFFYRNTSDHHTDILKSLNSLVALIGIFGLLCGIVVWGFDYFAFDYRKGINAIKLKEIYSSHIEDLIKNHTLDYLLGNFVLILVFIGLFLGVVWEHSRTVLVILGYSIVLMFFIISPKYLVPAMSFFDTKRALFDPICTLGGLYTILFGFLAYSFIKTIRKNSIIPS